MHCGWHLWPSLYDGKFYFKDKLICPSFCLGFKVVFVPCWLWNSGGKIKRKWAHQSAY
jgi:hypothetical protein